MHHALTVLSIHTNTAVEVVEAAAGKALIVYYRRYRDGVNYTPRLGSTDPRQ